MAGQCLKTPVEVIYALTDVCSYVAFCRYPGSSKQVNVPRLQTLGEQVMYIGKKVVFFKAGVSL